MKKKLCAFTLAEVLITLGIIGVVAAMTIPTLMQKTNRSETVAAVKKFYANFTNAVKLAEAEHGNKFFDTKYEYNNEYGLNGEYSIYIKYIMDNLKYIKACGNYDTPGCFADYDMLDENYSGDLVLFTLADGMSFAIENDNWTGTVVFDVNGVKGPNKENEDIFSFDYNLRDSKFGTEEINSGNNGFGWIMKYGNMDYLDN
ncbi:type II secretion system protein [bacterium]|nr:type II secretion system protein [bacterium]